jgi:hypothetical protein
MKKKLEIIEIYKPHDLEPHKRWNNGLFVVKYKNKKYQMWSHRHAREKAVELSTGNQIIADYTSGD